MHSNTESNHSYTSEKNSEPRGSIGISCQLCVHLFPVSLTGRCSLQFKVTLQMCISNRNSAYLLAIEISFQRLLLLFTQIQLLPLPFYLR